MQADQSLWRMDGGGVGGSGVVGVGWETPPFTTSVETENNKLAGTLWSDSARPHWNRQTVILVVLLSGRRGPTKQNKKK